MPPITPPNGRCAACLQPLQPMRHQGNPRKWCSEGCRQWAFRNPHRFRPVDRRCGMCLDPIIGRTGLARYCSASCRLGAEGLLGRERLAEILERRARNELEAVA